MISWTSSILYTSHALQFFFIRSPINNPQRLYIGLGFIEQQFMEGYRCNKFTSINRWIIVKCKTYWAHKSLRNITDWTNLTTASIDPRRVGPGLPQYRGSSVQFLFDGSTCKGYERDMHLQEIKGYASWKLVKKLFRCIFSLPMYHKTFQNISFFNIHTAYLFLERLIYITKNLLKPTIRIKIFKNEILALLFN